MIGGTKYIKHNIYLDQHQPNPLIFSTLPNREVYLDALFMNIKVSGRVSIFYQNQSGVLTEGMGSVFIYYRDRRGVAPKHWKGLVNEAVKAYRQG